MVKQYVESDALRETIKDNLSPEAVAAIAYLLDLPAADDWTPEVRRQVKWFRKQLVELLGGKKQLDDLVADGRTFKP